MAKGFQFNVLRQIDLKSGIIVMEMHLRRPLGYPPIEAHATLDSLHRDPKEGPAYLAWDAETGRLTCEEYYWEGKCHRDDGPAEIRYDAQTGERLLTVYFQDGRFHRNPKQGPAITAIAHGGTREEAYYFNGSYCRDPADGPYLCQWSRSGKILYEKSMTANEFRAAMAGRPAPRPRARPLQAARR